MTLHPGRAGSKHYYNQGCRCEECREASRLLKKRYRDQARAEGRESYFRELSGARALKRTYTGICRECGATTRYNGHGKRVSDLCRECAEKPRTHCKRGHLLTDENCLWNNGHHVCRVCRNAYMREYSYRKRREAGIPERGPYLSRRRFILQAEAHPESLEAAPATRERGN